MFTYNPAEPQDRDRIRLLISDVDEDTAVFSDEEIDLFLSMEGTVRLAAAQALDAIADNEALCSKVIRTQDLQTDGAKLADALRKRAQSLRDQEDEETEGPGFFDIVPGAGCSPEHVSRGGGWF